MNRLLQAVMGAEDQSDVTPVDAIVVPETVEAIATEIASGEVAEITAEVTELAAEVEDTVDDVEELQDAVEELQEAVAGSESFLDKKNQWNPTAFAIYHDRAERLHMKLGGEAIPAIDGTEALGDATTAELATRAGLEEMGKTVKAFGARAVAFIKSIWETIINFIKGLFNKSVKIKTLAASLTARLNSADVKVKEEIKLGKWNSWVDIEHGGDFSNRAVFGDALKSIGEAASGAEALIKDPKAFGPLKSDLDAAASSLGKIGNLATNLKKSEKGGVVHQSGTFRGVNVSYTHFTGEVKDVEGVGKQARALRISFKPGTEAVKTAGAVKTSLTVEKLKGLVKVATGINDGLVSSKIDGKFNAASRDRVIGLLRQIDDKENADKAVTAVKSVYGALSSVSTSVSRASLDFAVAHLDAVRAAL